MLRKYALMLLLPLAACSDPKMEIGVYAGPHGSTIALMAAKSIRTTGEQLDRRFDARPVARAVVARNELTDEILVASLDSMTADTLVVAVMTRFLSAGALQATQKFNAAGFPYIALTPVPPEVVGGSTWGFSLMPDYNKQAAFIAKHVGAGKRVVIIHINDAYGQGMAAALSSELTKAGSAPVDVRKYEQAWDEPRMIALGHDARSKRPNVLVFAGRTPSLSLVVQPFREANENVRVIGTDLVESANLYHNSDAGLTGVEFVRILDPMSQEPRMKDLALGYVLWIGSGQITTEGVLVHDAMRLMGEAARAGARTRTEMRDYLKSLGRTRPPFSGVSGLISFGDDGQVDRKMELARVGLKGVYPEAKDSAADRR